MKNLNNYKWNPVIGYFRRNLGILGALAVMVIGMSITSEHFLTSLNMKTLLLAITTNTLLGLGMTTMLIAGYIDLSIGSTYAIGGVVLVKIMQDFGVSFYTSFVATLLIGAFIGLFIGFLVAYTKIPAFILTVAMSGFLRGIAYLIAGDKARVMSTNPTLAKFGNGSLLGIPNQAWIIVIVALLLHFLLYNTVLGRHLYASGGNGEAAVYSGVNTKKICMISYVIMGILTVLAGGITASRISSGQPSQGANVMGDAVAAAVLGGTAFSGGRGTVGGTLIGALLIGVISNGLNLLEVNYYYQLIFKGVLIVFAIWLDTVKQSRIGS